MIPNRRPTLQRHPLGLLRPRRERPSDCPPSSVMNSRRLSIRSPRRRGRAASGAFEAQRFGGLEIDGEPVLRGSLTAGFSPLTMRSTYETKRPPGSVADFVTGIRPAYSPDLAWQGLTAPPAPAHPVGRSVEHPGSGIVRSPGGTRGTSGRHRCSGKDRRRRK
jgi:hypothetical protein